MLLLVPILSSTPTPPPEPGKEHTQLPHMPRLLACAVPRAQWQGYREKPGAFDSSRLGFQRERNCARGGSIYCRTKVRLLCAHSSRAVAFFGPLEHTAVAVGLADPGAASLAEPTGGAVAVQRRWPGVYSLGICCACFRSAKQKTYVRDIISVPLGPCGLVWHRCWFWGATAAAREGRRRFPLLVGTQSNSPFRIRARWFP